MSDFSKRIAALPPEKRALLLQKLQQKQEKKAAADQIVPRTDTAPFYPASFAQERFWFLYQLNPTGELNSIPTAIRVTDSVDVLALERTFNTIVERHEVLRTTFEARNGNVVQLIKPPRPFRLPFIDLRGLSEVEQAEHLERLAREEAKRPFDLTTGPMIRFFLLRRTNDHLLLFHVHHIVSDDWSTGVFVRELNQLYDAFTNGHSPQLPPLPIQYVDYTLWQRHQFESQQLQKQLIYWQNQLSGKLPILAIPTDYPRPAVRTFAGARQTHQLPSTTWQAIKQIGQQEGATLYMTLLTVFNILLYRYSHQTDILIGSPIANRTRTELQNLIGCFINTLVLRTNLSGQPSFRQLLQQVRQTTLDAYAHADIPFGKLVDTLQPERDLSRTPIFQAMFVMQDPVSARESRPSHALEVWDIVDDISEFDLTLLFNETQTTLSATVVYNTDLFHPNTMTRLLDHFQLLLDGIIANPDQTITTLPLLTPAEQQQQKAWANTQTTYPHHHACLHHLVEQQAKQTPQAIAITLDDQSITYQTLDTHANQLAHTLQAHGVGPEQVVGLCVDRSLEMIIAILAILKAGGAYLPLDPNYPPERLNFILQDAHPCLLLSQHHLKDRLNNTTIQTLVLDQTESESAPTTAVSTPISPVTSQNAAYVIYTSGSTGIPKGVVITHQAICNLVQAQIEAFHIHTQSAVLQFASFSFDASVSEIFTTLCAGATLHIAHQDALLPGDDLINTLRQRAITTITLPPSVLSLQTAVSLPHLQTLISAGERCTADIVTRWSPHHRFLNAYGPTEVTICATISDPLQPSQAMPPIGHALANTQVHILDAEGQRLPLGIPGEIHVGGIGVARGYLNRPALTAEKFIPDPFSTQPGARLYKTGDLAKYITPTKEPTTGDLLFLGRVDRQVKIRGFRIELQEIEAILNQHPALQAGYITTRERNNKTPYLVAYLVIKPEFKGDLNQSLRHFLKEKLPPYMIPATFITLDALPLTPNGKVDNAALPAPEEQGTDSQKAFVAPRTSAEETLVNIWAEVLDNPHIGIHDNFFELGGDSILSLQVVSRANESGLPIVSKQIFQYQTIAALAQEIDSNLTPVITAEQGPISGTAPLTPIQRWFFERPLSHRHHWNNIILLQLPPNTAVSALQHALQHLQTHHDALRLRFTQTDEGWHQHHISPHTQEHLLHQKEVAHLSPSAQNEAIQATALQLHTTLHLEKGPLLQACLFTFGHNENGRLLIVIHHLIFDGVSLRLLINDLITAYQQAAQNQPIQLAPKTTAFKTWSKRLITYAQTETVHQELPFWAKQSAPTTIPTDFQKGENNEGTAMAVSVSLNSAETTALLQELPTTYRTHLNEILLTALVQTITTWANTDQLLIDLEAHGREEALIGEVNLSRTIGWFTALYPVLLTLDSTDKATADLLRQIKSQLRQIPNRGIGYGLLRYVSQESALQDHTLAPISFNYLGQFSQSRPAPFTPLPIEPVGSIWGPMRNNANLRTHLIEVTATIIDNHLQFIWAYSTNYHHHDTINQLAQTTLTHLRSLMDSNTTNHSDAFIPSDFPLAQLDQNKLGDIFKKLNQL